VRVLDLAVRRVSFEHQAIQGDVSRDLLRW
jgi:hypothetical protein